MNEQKILNILYDLKEFCRNNVCANCPLSDNDSNCIVTKHRPSYWKLNNKLPEKWSAFRLEDMG